MTRNAERPPQRPFVTNKNEIVGSKEDAAASASRPWAPTSYSVERLERIGLASLPAPMVHFTAAFVMLATVFLSGRLLEFTSAHALAALIIMAYAWLALLLTDALVFFLSFPLFSTVAPMVASVTYLEFGNFISEQGTSGYASGATVRLSFYCLIVFFAFYLVLRPLLSRLGSVRSPQAITRFAAVSQYLFICVLLVAIATLAVYGSPLLDGVDRFEYYSQLPGAFSRLPFLMAMMSFLVVSAVAFDPNRSNIVWAACLIPISIGVLLLFSEKFTGLFSIFMLSVTGGYAVALFHRQVRLRLGRLVALCAIVGLALLSVASVGYMVFYGYTTETVFEKLADRALALNGHVWFGTDRSLQAGAPNGHISALFPQPSYDGLSGIQQVMYLVAPADFVGRMVDAGVRFANVGFPLPVWVLGYGWSVPYFASAGAIAALVMTYLMFSLSRLNIFSTLIALNALRQVTNALLVGDVSDMYKPLAVAGWLYMTADLCVYVVRARRRSTNVAATAVSGPL